MLARVKQDRSGVPVRAFSGHEYVRYEWRKVPLGCEGEALVHELLDTKPEKGDPALPKGKADKVVEESKSTSAALLAEILETPEEAVEEVAEPEAEPPVEAVAHEGPTHTRVSRPPAKRGKGKK
jgi:hypothetical protein